MNSFSDNIHTYKIEMIWKLLENVKIFFLYKFLKLLKMTKQIICGQSGCMLFIFQKNLVEQKTSLEHSPSTENL